MPVKRSFFHRKNRLRYRASSRLDFSWEKTSQNPYIHKPSAIKPPRRRTIQIGVGALAILGTIGILLLNPLFQIHDEQIKILGLKQISSVDFRGAVLGILGNPIFKFLPRNNYLILNTDELRDILLRRYAIASVTTQKVFPNSLIITVTEKPPVILYDNGYAYATVGINGEVVDLLQSVSADERSQFPGFPLVSESNPRPLHANADVLTPELIQKILSWNTALVKTMNIPIDRISLLNNNADADVTTGEGWHIKIHLDREIDEQLSNLNLVMREKSFPRPHLNYVDLRYKAHIFWQ